MSTCGKMISSGKRRFLIDAKEPSLVPDLIDSLKEEFPNWSVLIYEDAASFCSSAMTGDLFSDGNPRILVLWGFDEDAVGTLEPLISHDSVDTLIVVQRVPIQKSRVYTRFRSEWELLSLQPFDDKACEAYAASVLKRHGCQFGSDVPSLIVERKERILPAIKKEAKKLSFFGRPVDRDMASRVVCGKIGVKLFDLVDAVLRRRWVQSFFIVGNLLDGDFIGFLHAMQTQCMKLYKAAFLKDQGMSPDEIATMLEVTPYIARTKIIPLASQRGRQRVLKMMDVIHEMDELVRISRVPKRILIEVAIARLLRS